MENTQMTLERENPSLQTSPKSNNRCITTNNNDVESPPTPKPKPQSETNGFPTTFIHADLNSFKQVVQMLTGFPETTTTTKQASKPVGPVKARPKKPGFKLHERRNSTLKNLKIITGLPPTGHPKILSPSFLDLHKLDIHDRSSSPSSCNFFSLEEKLVAKRGFYLLDQSPVATPKGSEPQLLPLFPVTSPRVSGTS